MKNSIHRFAAIVIFSILASMLASQNGTYKPFPETYGKWIVHETHWGAPGCPHSDDFWQKYEMSGDTVIGVHTYKKVYEANNTGYPAPNGDIPFGPRVFSFGYRNDSTSKKVFICIGATNKDTLWYDFNLSVGDTLPETYAFAGGNSVSGNERRVVSSIDDVLICGIRCKRFNFDCAVFNTSLVEGQGFVDRFFKTAYSDCPFEPCTTYGTAFAHCDFTGLTELDANKSTFSLLANPVSNVLTIKADEILVKESLILDPSGRVILRKSHASNIEVNALSPGIYLLRLETEQGQFCQKFIKE